MVEIIVSSLYNESIYHLLCVKRGAIMKKLFLLLTIFSLFTMSAFAVSLDELRNSPEKYKHIYADQTHDEYIEIPSINVIRYNPPYYTINATTYTISYDKNLIIKQDNTFFYNYNRSVDSLIKRFNTEPAVTSELKKDTGIRFQITGIGSYNYSGQTVMPYQYIDPSSSLFPPLKAHIFSPGYMAAMYSFFKSYNMYFNPPSKNQLF